MSKITTMNRNSFRWQLLASVSAAALLASTYGAGIAQAADSDRPSLWIELGGQLDRLSNAQEQFSPAFLSSVTQPGLLSALSVQQPPAYGIDAEGKISFQPDGSAWVFSASIRYGRSQSSHHKHQQTKNALIPMHISFYGLHYDKYYYPSRFVRFTDGEARQSERHTVLDFQVGKDVGLGILGEGSSSILSAGVRFVQFTSKTAVNHLSGAPDLQYPTAPLTSITNWLDFKYGGAHFHHYDAAASIQRSFRGVGPSLTWNASMPFAGHADSTELTFDWGANAALLFGRQKARGHHQTVTRTYDLTGWARGANANGMYGKAFPGVFGTVDIPHFLHHTNAADIDRTRSVTVPNLGGFAGISLKWPNAKISVGYRADFFFGAIDGGIDTRKSENRAFFGPYASISIGLGD